MRSLDDDFVRAVRRHPVVYSLRGASRVAFDMVERAEMRKRADLPGTFRGQIEKHPRLETVLRAERARVRRDFFRGGMSDYHPTARDGIFTKFH
jgi:hypothetical protein